MAHVGGSALSECFETSEVAVLVLGPIDIGESEV